VNKKEKKFLNIDSSSQFYETFSFLTGRLSQSVCIWQDFQASLVFVGKRDQQV
jgi:hypothetical protein